MGERSDRESLGGLSVWHRAAAGTHLAVSIGIGVVVGVLVGSASGWEDGALAAWVAAGTVFLAWTWATIWPLGEADTARMAKRQDPSRPVRDLLLLAGAVVNVLVVAFVIFRAHQSGALRLSIGVACVAVSWAVLHTIFTLKYARIYYSEPVGGIDFKQEIPPSYRDFAYVAFTVGMTFQVSDTDVGKGTIRSTVLGHALVSFLFGAVIIAVTINLVAGLSR